MLTKLLEALFKKLETYGLPGQRYIVPTLDGMKLVALNFVLLVIGLVYANNYVLLFNFILFCLFLGSMFYTHFNLQGLTLLSAKLTPVHVNENSVLTLNFKTTSRLGHYFLGIRFTNPLLDLVDRKYTFSHKADSLLSFKVDIPVRGMRRGSLSLNSLCVETLFPFHLFRCFIYFKPLMDIVVYPEKKDLKIHLTESTQENNSNDQDDFTLNDFKPGDPLKRVHWKKLAQTNRWYSKSLITPNANPLMLLMTKNHLSALETEEQLSSLCSALYQLHYQNIKYGLAVGNIVISPDHSFFHLNHCLHVLADYEN